MSKTTYRAIDLRPGHVVQLGKTTKTVAQVEVMLKRPNYVTVRFTDGTRGLWMRHRNVTIVNLPRG